MNEPNDPADDALREADESPEAGLPTWFDEPPPEGGIAAGETVEPPVATALGDPATLAAVPEPGARIVPRESQRSIVMRQFRKQASAMWGWRITVAMVFLAIFAPLVASGQPLFWKKPRADGGEVTLPWFRNLFDRNVYQFALDRLFNLVMIVLAARFLLRAFVRIVGGSDWRSSRWRRFDRWVGGIALVGSLVVGVAMMLPRPEAEETGIWKVVSALDPTTSRSYAPYADAMRRYGEHRDAAEELARADLTPERRTEILAQFPRLAEFPSPSDWEFRRITTLIPYGYREQGSEREDAYLPFWSFERGPHVLGTDATSRDVFAMVLYGLRIALTVGIVAVSIYILIGTILGCLAGYFRGWVDMVIMRTVEIFLCVPTLFLLLLVVAMTPADQRTVFLTMAVIGLISWTGTARLVRGEFLAERNKEYVAAAQMLGLSRGRIIFRHILPNALSPVIVTASFGVAGAILLESGLSFLGLGDPNYPSWGSLLNEGRVSQRWHLIWPPSIAIFVTVTALNLVGDGLRDALDPKLRR